MKLLTILVENISPYILHAKIGAPGRWEVPRKLFNAPNVTGVRHTHELGAWGALTLAALTSRHALQSDCSLAGCQYHFR